MAILILEVCISYQLLPDLVGKDQEQVKRLLKALQKNQGAEVAYVTNEISIFLKEKCCFCFDDLFFETNM